MIFSHKQLVWYSPCFYRGCYILRVVSSLVVGIKDIAIAIVNQQSQRVCSFSR